MSKKYIGIIMEGVSPVPAQVGADPNQQQNPQQTMVGGAPNPQMQDPNAMAAGQNALMNPMDPSQQGMNAGMGGMDPNSAGALAMGNDQFGAGGMVGGYTDGMSLDSTDLGKIYSINKIYYRLNAIYNLLSDLNIKELNSISEMVNESILILNMTIQHIAKYKDKLDEVILKYYTFLLNLTLFLKKFFKEHRNELNRKG